MTFDEKSLLEFVFRNVNTFKINGQKITLKFDIIAKFEAHQYLTK